MEILFNILFGMILSTLFACTIILLLSQARHTRKVNNLDNEYEKLVREFKKVTNNLDKSFAEKLVSFEQNVVEMEKFMQAEYKSFLAHLRRLKDESELRKEIPKPITIIDFKDAQKQIVIKKEYTPIEELHMSERTKNALLRSGIGSIEQLVSCTCKHISIMSGIGVHALYEINKALASRNLSLTPDKYE